MRRINKIISLLLIVLTLVNIFPALASAKSKVTISKEMNKDKYYEITMSQKLNCVESTTIVLPDNFIKETIEGVSIQNDKEELLSADIAINKNIVTITPIDYDYFKEGKTYTIRLFCVNGKRYEIKMKAQIVGNIDFSTHTLIKVPASPEKGFNYPYYLYVPAGTNTSKYNRMMVEPNNSGYVSDYLGFHDERARDKACDSINSFVAEELKIPYLVPVFPRPFTEWWDNYYHTLSRDVMLQTSGDGVRVDLQLIAMIKDAQNLLSKQGIKLEKKVFMTGFSASGQFVNRFTVLHPEWVKAVFHGGFTMYPTDSIDGNTLYFPLGTADIEELTGKKFNLEEYKKVAQFVYTGDLDRNDRIVETAEDYNAYDAEVMHKLYKTEDPMKIWAKKEELMKRLGFDDNIQFFTYKGVGHSLPQPASIDMINFFIKNNGDEIVKIEAHKDGRYYRYEDIVELLK